MRIFLILFFFICNFSFGQRSSDEVILNCKAHIQFLASDSLRGRTTGSKEEKCVNEYLAKKYVSNKKSKTLKWKYTISTDTGKIKTTMMGCFINNNSEYTLLISAHADHIGMGGGKSMSIGKPVVHNGADDNASGVAITIELQNELIKHNLPFNILFVNYSGHEIGLFGSKYLYDNWNKKHKNIFTVINLDMVGRLDSINSKLYVSATDSLMMKMKNINASVKITELDSSNLYKLDTKYFANDNVPSATVTTGVHSDYHKPSDDVKYINFKGVFLIYDYFLKLILDDNFFPGKK